MRWWLYNILFFLGYMAMMPSFYRRMKKRGGYRAHFGQRLGRYEPEVLAALAEKRRIWVHAVSVGEAYVAGRILDALRRARPGASVVLSTTSSTGYKVCESLVREGDVLVYFPVDFPRAVRRALDAIRPEALVLTESELWPNILLECQRRGIPTILMNGRVSDRSFPRYRALRFFFGPVLRSFREIQVQFETDRERMLAMGAAPDTVKVTGTVKFDVATPDPAKVASVRAGLAAAGFPPDAKILLGASTWPGEEKTLLETYTAIRKTAPEFRLVLVPRHAERGDEIEALIHAEGYECWRRSRHAEAPARQESHAEGAEAPARQGSHAEVAEAPARQESHAEFAEASARQESHAEFAEGAENEVSSSRNLSPSSVLNRSAQARPTPAVLLADTTGELFAFHAVSDLTFVGKTLDPNIGAQNMIEPCALGKPVVVGPHVENFAGPMAILLAADAVRQERDAAAVRSALVELAADATAREALGRRAASAVATASGALERGVDSLLRALDNSNSSLNAAS